MFVEDIILEVIRAMFSVAVVALMLEAWGSHKNVRILPGSSHIILGFCLLAFGSIIDITDNFDSLNQYILIGDTPIESFLEKVVGYLLGFLFIAIGINKWLPSMLEHQEHIQNKLEHARAEVKQLEKLLRICASCKKIHAKDGTWSEVDVYIRQNTGTDFTHGLCPTCLTIAKEDLD